MGLKFIFDYIDSEQEGLTIVSARPMDTAERDVSVYDIPGRDGQLIQDNGRYRNASVEIEIAGKLDAIQSFSSAMRARIGYKRLELSWLLNEFREAALDGLTWSMKRHNVGVGTVRFNCKPQRFLTSGETAETFDEDDTILNPTEYDALPIVVVHGSGNGTVTIGGYTMTLTGFTDGITIDSELRSAYKNGTNMNSVISGEFFQIHAGENAVEFTGGVTSVVITPRWYTI